MTISSSSPAGNSFTGLGRKRAIEYAPTKPRALEVNKEGIPPELRTRTRWVCWRYKRVQDENGQEHWSKLPSTLTPGARPTGPTRRSG